MIPNDFDTAFGQVIELVNDFNKDLANCTRSEYNESQVRKDYIDKFFISLGWDVNHEQQRNIYAQEVRVEKTIKNIAARTKFADYSFALDPEFRKAFFFVEAKKPFVTLETPSNCFQTIRYGYSSSKAKLSILTNFKEFIVLDCRYLPDFDTATQRIHKKYHFTDFLNFEKFAEIYYLFGREAVADGTYERVCSELPKPKGRVKQLKLFADGYKEIDDSFLEMLEGFREALAKNFKKKNPTLNSDDLTEAVQRTLDRLVFIRFLEDKLIEPDTILDKFGFKPNAWGQFIAKSSDFDKTYNGIIFKEHFIDKPDFVVDDRVFLDICDTFAGDRTPYHFNYIPIHILGSIYERFLGNVIVATAKQARIEAKPEVRKAGGVFYTPHYIVKYIVENTVGALLQGSERLAVSSEQEESSSSETAHRLQLTAHSTTPADVAKMRFADIACGSGSFLLGVYEYLLTWHTGYYNQKGNADEAKKAGCIVNEDGTFHLSFEQKSDILVNNVYGVDIDRQAHEVTQLSLFLKLLEEETLATRRLLWDTERKAMLPSLAQNIICGNALVDWDISSGDLFFDGDQQEQLKPMSFKTKFPSVMRNGGFDAIVGNPPYVRMEAFKPIKGYLKEKYLSHDERSDLYAYFIEKANKLLNNHGKYGVIVSNKFLRSNYGKPLRDFLAANTNVEQVIDFAGLPVFAGATVRTIVLITSPKTEVKASTIRYMAPVKYEVFQKLRNGPMSVSDLVTEYAYDVPRSSLTKDVWSFGDGEKGDLLDTLKARSISLAEYSNGQICMGIKSGLTEAFVISSEQRNDILERNPEAEEIIKPYLNGREVRQYSIENKNQYLIYTFHGVNIAKYPAIKKHLEPFKDKLNNRATKQAWYELQQPQLKFAPFLDAVKIIFPDIAATPRFALDVEGRYGSNTTYFIPRNDLYLLGLLNSNLGFFYFLQTCAGLEGTGETYLRFFGQYLEGFPVKTIDKNNAEEKAKHDLIVHAVEQIMDAKAKLATAKNDGERQHLTDKCEKYETDINTAVYSLYGLTEDEKKLIENT